MALVVGGADDRRPGAGSALAAIAGRAGEAIVAAGSVRLGGIRAEAGRGVAGAGDVALVEGGADDRRPGAGSALAAVAGRAGEAIEIGRASCRGRVWISVGGGLLKEKEVGLGLGGAEDRRSGAGSARAAIAGRAGEAIVTVGCVRLCGIRAEAGRGVAGAGDVALVEGGADDRRPGAGSALAAVAGRAGEAIVTAGSVGVGGVVGRPGGRRMGGWMEV